MTLEEALRRRLTAVVKLLMTNGPRAVSCCNVDTSLLPAVDVPLPVPSIEHSIVQCSTCHNDMWIGPEQRRQPLPRICYLCTIVLMNLLGKDEEVEVVAINPNEANIPRRR